MSCVDDLLDDPIVRMAEEADAKRFPEENVRFEDWCGLPTLTLEEATALSMGLDPRIISREIINRQGLLTHPYFVQSEVDILRLSVRADIYEERLRHIERACRVGEVENAQQIGDTWEVPPLDILAWFERQGGRYRLHPHFVRQFTADAGRADTGKQGALASSHGVSNAGKGGVGFSSLGSFKDRKNIREAWALICSELRKPVDKRQFRTMKELRDHCEDKLGVRYHDCLELARQANQEPGAIPYPPGRPPKSRTT